MYIPASLIKDWPGNEVVGFEANMSLRDTGSLHLLMENDFVCMDAKREDQMDNYDNPHKTVDQD